MELRSEQKFNGEFRVHVIPYEEEVVSECISVFNRDTVDYTVEGDFKKSLFTVLRDVADFERISLAELLCSYLSAEEKEDLLDELNVI